MNFDIHAQLKQAILECLLVQNTSSSLISPADLIWDAPTELNESQQNIHCVCKCNCMYYRITVLDSLLLSVWLTLNSLFLCHVYIFFLV